MIRLFSFLISTDFQKLQQDSSNRSSSALNKLHQIRREEKPESRSSSSKKSHTDTCGPSKTGQDEASRAPSTSKKAVSSIEVRKKQKITAISSSQKRRLLLQSLWPRSQKEVSQVRSSSARRRSPQYSQQAENYDDDDDEDDLYKDPVIKQQGPQGPSSTIPIRHSQNASSSILQVPQGQDHGLPSTYSTQAMNRTSFSS